MSSFPTIAVLIPAHNAGAWLQKAVASALAQEAVRAQVVVCDDGSTDGSIDNLEKSIGNAVTILRQPQRGGNVARNALLAATRCEWVQFLDADDYLQPHKIVRQFIEAGPLDSADLLYSPVLSEQWSGNRPALPAADPIDTSTDLFTQWISWQLPQTGGVLWRRTALVQLGGWKEDQPCCQEHELYLRALQAALRWKFCPTPGAVYRLWSEKTVSRRNPVKVIEMRTALIDQLMHWLIERGLRTPGHVAAAGQAGFEMARTWAQYDLDAATAYVRRRREAGFFLARGPAAPLTYRLVHAVAGFRRAEQLAHILRRSGPCPVPSP